MIYVLTDSKGKFYIVQKVYKTTKMKTSDYVREIHFV